METYSVHCFSGSGFTAQATINVPDQQMKITVIKINNSLEKIIPSKIEKKLSSRFLTDL